MVQTIKKYLVSEEIYDQYFDWIGELDGDDTRKLTESPLSITCITMTPVRGNEIILQSFQELLDIIKPFLK